MQGCEYQVAVSRQENLKKISFWKKRGDDNYIIIISKNKK